MSLIPKTKTPAENQARYLEWVEEIEKDGTGLNTWEEDFVDNVGTYLRGGGRLSEAQAEILERILNDRT